MGLFVFNSAAVSLPKVNIDPHGMESERCTVSFFFSLVASLSLIYHPAS
jgi:hypothetical protein